jgi:nucleotide-binding universal stress UspA family protein
MFKRILCATDGSVHGERAVREGARMAQASDGELHVAHVIERVRGGGRLRGQNVFVSEPEIDNGIRRQVEQLILDDHIDVKVHMISRGGQPARRLAQLAERIGADLIVVGSRGHAPLRGVVLGSVTQQLLHESNRPVLAVPPACEPDGMPAAESEPAIAA